MVVSWYHSVAPRPLRHRTFLPPGALGAPPMPVTSLQLSNIGPFDSVEFTFDHQINVFTGANNTGKSTALWSLGELLVYPFAIPDRLLREPDSEWHIQIQTGHNHDNSSGRFPIDPGQLLPIYRTMGHSCFIPAQRHTSDYRSSGPTSKRDIESQIDEEIESMSQARPSLAAEIAPEDLRRMVRGWKTDQDPELTKRSDLMVSAAFFVSNEPLIQKIIDLDYRSLRLNRPDIRLVIKKAFEVVSDITQGFPIEFVGISEDERGLFPKVRTLKGELPITVLSQGTMSILHCISYLLFGYGGVLQFPARSRLETGSLDHRRNRCSFAPCLAATDASRTNQALPQSSDLLLNTFAIDASRIEGRASATASARLRRQC